MARLRTVLARAAALHRQAAAITAAGARALDEYAPEPTHTVEQRQLAERLRALAADVAPGWLGVPLDAAAASHPLGGHDMPGYVRIGAAQPLDDARFPVVVPLLTHGHLTIDADARDPRVAGLLRSVVLRLLAAAPAGTMRLRAVDPTLVFARFAGLADSGLMPPPVTDRAGLAAVLTEAEQWVRRPPRRDRLLLVVIASLPELTDAAELSRIAALAQAGPATGLHLVVAGWPPPLTDHDALPLATEVAMRNPHAEVSLFDVPVYLDEDPPGDLVDRVCLEVAEQASAAAKLRLTDLMPDRPQWTEDATDGLATVVGYAGDSPVTLRFNDLTPHWMIGGRSGAGKTSFLLNVLCGLVVRYPPSELALYLLDFSDGESFAELARDPGWLPHARAIGVQTDREYGLAVLRELAAELDRRAGVFPDGGTAKYADLRAAGIPAPRTLCVIDECEVLFAGDDAIATEAVALLESLARKGRSYGIHVVLGCRTAVEAVHGVLGQFPVRIALPGGAAVLDPANEAATGLPIGAAVVNTAGGFGGPRGAIRGHEKTVHFPDPSSSSESAFLAGLRKALWRARPAGNRPPAVFAGQAARWLDDDPTFLDLAPNSVGRPTVFVGRSLDATLSPAEFRLDAAPGRHLAVLGPSGTGADVLDAAARSVAAQHAPGSARFLLAALTPDTVAAVERLAGDLGSAGHTVTSLSSLPPSLDDGPAYLVLFGADEAPAEALRAVLRDGPARGHHVFGWWRGLRRFTEDAREDVAGLVLLNVPGADVERLLGRAVEWRPRPNRALLHDRDADRTAVFVPFQRRGDP